MNCQKCLEVGFTNNTKFKVWHSRPYVVDPTKTYRELLCVRCGTRIETLEIPLSDYDTLMAAAKTKKTAAAAAAPEAPDTEASATTQGPSAQDLRDSETTQGPSAQDLRDSETTQGPSAQDLRDSELEKARDEIHRLRIKLQGEIAKSENQEREIRKLQGACQGCRANR